MEAMTTGAGGVAPDDDADAIHRRYNQSDERVQPLDSETQRTLGGSAKLYL